MQLNVFISQNTENILIQWESFAGSLLPAASGMSGPSLREHAQQILEAIVTHMDDPQFKKEQIDNSKGLIPNLPGAPQTSAEKHGLLRAMNGFEMGQVISEYRALRANILKLWFVACGTATPNFDDIVLFNEAIDQALSESINFFTHKVDERRNLFLGMLCHDMRTPLQAIQMTAILIQRISAEKNMTKAATRLVDCGSRMDALLNELIQFNQIKLVLGVQIVPTPQDMASLVGDELNQLRVRHPDKKINLQVSGPTKGVWDGESLKRVLGNLVVNAIKYGNESSPITIRVAGHAEKVTFEVRNKGTSMDTPTLQALFEPFRQANTTRDFESDGLGLGLFIAKQVVVAHDGGISARCENGDTVFSVQVPTVSLGSPSRRQ